MKMSYIDHQVDKVIGDVDYWYYLYEKIDYL